MRRTLGAALAAALCTPVLVVLTPTSASAAPAAAPAADGGQDVVVLRVGTGDGTLSGAAAPAFLDEYSPSGALVRSTPLPTTASGSDRRLTVAGSSTSEGSLTRSADGRYLALAGYDAAPGTASVASTTTSAVNRVLARVDAAGTVDTSTPVTDAFSGGNVRGAATDDGSRFWAVGSTSGLRSLPHGGGASTQVVATPTNLRSVTTAGGDLYFSTGSGTPGVYAVTGLPTASGQSARLVAPSASPYGIVALDRDATVPGIDTVYVADDSGAPNGGILKFSSDGSTWTARGSFRPAGSAARGLTGSVTASGATLYATTTSGAGSLVAVTDTAAFDAPIDATGTTLVTGASGTALRGVALAPTGGSSSTAPSISSQPQDTTIAPGDTATLTVTASGTPPLSYQWYRGQAGDTSTPVGTDTASFTTPALQETTAYWVRVTGAGGSADSRTATVTVQAPAPSCTGSVTKIGEVQGTGETSPLAGKPVTIRGTVVSDVQGAQPALGGFYLQDSGDGDAATSDGVFVFDRGAKVAQDVQDGDVVEVTGTAKEYQGQTQVDTLTAESVCGTADVTPTDVTLPLASPDALEPFEGMLVRFHQTLSVTEHFQLGRFGQVVLSSGGRLPQPTAYVEPGAAAKAQQAANDLNRVVLDDDSQAQNPDPIRFGRGGRPLSATNTLRGGDTVDDATGVLTYTWGGNAASPNAYRLRPLSALHGSADFAAANPRPTGGPEVGGGVKVGGANLLNFFNTFTGCTGGVGGAPLDCRGPNNATEYERQLAKESAALRTLDVDVLSVMEMENDGYGQDSAIQALVDRMNADSSAPGRWAFIDTDRATGTTNAGGTDAIKAAILYRTDRVTPTGKVYADQDAVWERRPVAAEFRSPTGRFTVVANHFKSKGSCPTSGPDTDQGDGQSCWNARRTAQAERLLTFLQGTVEPGTGEKDVLLLGDFNSYAKEDPVEALEAGGYTNLVGALHPGHPYSYAFDGQWGYLDYAFASPSLRAAVSGADDYHVNADEPSVLDYNTEFKSPAQVQSLYAPDQYRTSDHDSVRVGLDLDDTPPVITWQGSIEDGDRFVYGEVPPAPACTATDDAAGEVPCTVTGWSAEVGTHTLVATATDPSGNTATEERTYTVDPWTLTGFGRPVHDGTNVAKGGSTVPLKFSVRAGDRELTDTAAVSSVTWTPVDCSTGAATGPAQAADGTLRREDGQHVFEWRTPRRAGCERTTVTTADGSALSALFRLR